MKRCSKSLFSRAARIWLAAYLLVWALSCAWVWLFGVAPVYLMLFFGLFQFLVFPVLLFGTGAALGAARAAGAFVQHLAAEHAAGRPARRAGAFVRAVRLRGGVPGAGGRRGRACAAGQKMTKACPFFRRGAGQARQSEV